MFSQLTWQFRYSIWELLQFKISPRNSYQNLNLAKSLRPSLIAQLSNDFEILYKIWKQPQGMLRTNFRYIWANVTFFFFFLGGGGRGGILCCNSAQLTHLRMNKMVAISQTTFQMYFHELKALYLMIISQKFVPKGSIHNKSVVIGSDNGLAPNRQQAIIWTNVGPVHWRMYGALGGDELICAFYAGLWSITVFPVEIDSVTTVTTVVCTVVIIVTSYWARWRLKSPASLSFTQPFILAQIKENTKAPRHWPLWGEFTGNQWIPRTNGQ